MRELAGRERRAAGCDASCYGHTSSDMVEIYTTISAQGTVIVTLTPRGGSQCDARITVTGRCRVPERVGASVVSIVIGLAARATSQFQIHEYGIATQPLMRPQDLVVAVSLLWRARLETLPNVRPYAPDARRVLAISVAETGAVAWPPGQIRRPVSRLGSEGLRQECPIRRFRLIRPT